MREVDVYLTSDDYFNLMDSVRNKDFKRAKDYLPKFEVYAADILVNDKILIPAVLERNFEILSEWMELVDGRILTKRNNPLTVAIEENDLEIAKFIVDKCKKSSDFTIALIKKTFNPTCFAYHRRNHEMFKLMFEKFPISFIGMDEEFKKLVKEFDDPFMINFGHKMDQFMSIYGKLGLFDEDLSSEKILGFFSANKISEITDIIKKNN